MHLGGERVVATWSPYVSFALDVGVAARPVRHDHWNVTWPHIVSLLVILVVAQWTETLMMFVALSDLLFFIRCVHAISSSGLDLI